MPTTKLTNGLIARLKPGPKDQFVWDSQDKGFGVKVSPADKITFIVQKRLSPTTPAIRITIGDHGTFTADEAREVAREHLRTIRMGLDPRAVKKQAEAEAVTLQQTFDDYVARPDAIKDSTRKWYEFFVTKVFADWRKLPIVSITPDMVLARHRERTSNRHALYAEPASPQPDRA